jgi:hypothetical protein
MILSLTFFDADLTTGEDEAEITRGVPQIPASLLHLLATGFGRLLQQYRHWADEKRCP